MTLQDINCKYLSIYNSEVCHIVPDAERIIVENPIYGNVTIINPGEALCQPWLIRVRDDTSPKYAILTNKPLADRRLCKWCKRRIEKLSIEND